MGDVGCGWCGVPLPHQAGRNRRYCRPAHRQAAWRARRRWEAAATARQALVLAGAELLARAQAVAQQMGGASPAPAPAAGCHSAAVAEVLELAERLVRHAVLADRQAGAKGVRLFDAFRGPHRTLLTLDRDAAHEGYGARVFMMRPDVTRAGREGPWKGWRSTRDEWGPRARTGSLSGARVVPDPAGGSRVPSAIPRIRECDPPPGTRARLRRPGRARQTSKTHGRGTRGSLTATPFRA
jgi:hypothetical protein